MKLRCFFGLLTVALGLITPTQAELLYTPYTFSTLAGSPGVEGSDDGSGSEARFSRPRHLAVDSAGNVYVADTGNHTIRKVTPAGVVTTLAGRAGVAGLMDGTGSAALFRMPAGVAVDGAGNLYVADTGNNLIRKVTAAGVVTIFAGSTSDVDSAGIPNPGTNNGPAGTARFFHPVGVALDNSGNLYVADSQNHMIRKVWSGNVTTLAGDGGPGCIDNSGAGARFNFPSGVVVDGFGDLLVADQHSQAIRSVSPAGAVTTVAGHPNESGYGDGPADGAWFAQPSGVAVDGAGNLYVCDFSNNLIRQLISTVDGYFAFTLAGSPGTAGRGRSNGSGSAARFDGPTSVAVDSAGNLYVADFINNTIRKGVPMVSSYHHIALSGNLAFGNVTRGSTGTATLRISNTGTTPLTVNSISYPAGFSGTWSGAVAAGGFHDVTVTFAPTAVGPYAGTITVNSDATGGTSTIAASGVGLPLIVPNPTGYTWVTMPWSFRDTRGVAVDGSGNVYVSDTGKHTITKNGTTFAGIVDGSGYLDGPIATARFSSPGGVAVDGSGNVYVIDTANNAIRKIAGGSVSTLAGPSAGFNFPWGIACDGSGNVYVSDTDNYTIRKITAAGAVSTVAGSVGSQGRSDGIGIAARFYRPRGLAVDNAGGFLYVADGNGIRRVELATASVTTVLRVPAGGLDYYEGLSLTGDGNLIVTNTGRYTMEKVSPAGAPSTIGGLAGNFGDADGVGNAARFYWPWGVGVDSAGNVYVAEHNYAKVKKGVPPVVTTTKVIVLSGNLSFGNVLTDATATSTLTISNPGNTALTVSGISYPAGFQGAWSGIIPAGGSQNVTVTFAPSDAGSYGGTAMVTSDATDGTSTIPLSGTGVAPSGSLLVSIQPSGIPSAFGLWRVDGGNWQTSGVPVDGLSVGSHTVEFDSIYGWTKPPNQSVTVAKDATTTTTGTYVRQTGSLTVTITPAGAADAGARWQANGGSWNVSGATVSGLGVGGYSVRFSTVGGWTSPPDQMLAVTFGGNTLTTGVYVAGGTPTRIISLTGNLAFGNVPTGATGTATLTISNSGNSALTVSGISYPPGFSGAWSGTIPAGGSRNVTVTFAPASATTYGGTVTVNSDATSGTGTTAASGTGVTGNPANLFIYDPGFELNAGTLIPYGAQTGTSTWLEDFANGNAAGGASVLTGMFDDPIPDGAIFGWINGQHSVWQGLPHMLAPGTYTLSVWLGKRKDLGSVGWSPSVIQFDLLAGSATLNATTFTNNVPEVGRWVRAQKSYTITANDPNLGQPLVVRFTNPQSGNFQGNFDNVALVFQAANASTRIIGLTGDLTFGSVNAGAVATATLTITNSGNADLTVSNIAYPPGFSGAWNGTIPPGGSQNVTVTFAPNDATSYGGNVIVSSDATDGSATIVASGTGTSGPEIAVEQPAGVGLTDGSDTVNFGTFTAGNTAPSKAFAVRNTGTADLTGIALTKFGANASDFIVDAVGLPVTLAPGESATFAVTFRPGAAGTRTAALRIASNDADENPFDIALTGAAGPLPDIAVEAPKGVAMPAGSTKAFGTVAVRKRVNSTFVVNNTGAANLTGTMVNLTGPNASEFKLTANVSAPIKPGKGKNFKVQFAPLTPGVKTALLTITSIDPDESPYLVNLTGTAIAGREADRTLAKDYPEAGRDDAQGAAGSRLPFKARNGEGSEQALGICPPLGRGPLLASELFGTTWLLPMTSRVWIEGVGTEDGAGSLRLTFHDDGGLFLEDDSGVALEGTWTIDDNGELSAQIFPQSVEEYLRTALGNEPVFGVAADAVDLDLRLASDTGEPRMNVSLAFAASLVGPDPDTGQPVERKMTCDASAKGPQE